LVAAIAAPWGSQFLAAAAFSGGSFPLLFVKSPMPRIFDNIDQRLLPTLKTTFYRLRSFQPSA
jgi:hypothetical protein